MALSGYFPRNFREELCFERSALILSNVMFSLKEDKNIIMLLGEELLTKQNPIFILKTRFYI